MDSGSAQGILRILQAASGKPPQPESSVPFIDPSSRQTCVKRRAVLSVEANPSCKDRAMAERAVNEVWESCFKDTRPFDEIY